MATKINRPIPHGEFATFSVTTDVIAPYKYQWKRNGENLVHGNNKSYTTPPLKADDYKAKYSVQVFGQDKIEMSDEAVIDEPKTAPVTDKEKAAAATVITPKPHVPERRIHVGVSPTGVERRVA